LKATSSFHKGLYKIQTVQGLISLSVTLMQLCDSLCLEGFGKNVNFGIEIARCYGTSALHYGKCNIAWSFTIASRSWA